MAHPHLTAAAAQCRPTAIAGGSVDIIRASRHKIARRNIPIKNALLRAQTLWGQTRGIRDIDEPSTIELYGARAQIWICTVEEMYERGAVDVD